MPSSLSGPGPTVTEFEGVMFVAPTPSGLSGFFYRSHRQLPAPAGRAGDFGGPLHHFSTFF